MKESCEQTEQGSGAASGKSTHRCSHAEQANAVPSLKDPAAAAKFIVGDWQHD